MIYSMTGYGTAAVAYNGRKITVEVRALNAKALDLSTHLAPLYREKEGEVRQMVQERLLRGKIDVTITVAETAAATATPINGDLVEHYYKELCALAKERNIPLAMDWTTLLRLPDVLARPAAESVADDEWAAVKAAVEDACAALVAFRQQEGAALEGLFRKKIGTIRSLLAALAPYEEQRVAKIRSRLTDNLAQITDVDYDAGRLEQEMIYYLEKLDIAEEKQRLANHLDYFLSTLDEAGSQGKKLGFIAQEMGREINTTGSKANLAEMQIIVVQMKDELEQIKEQVFNVL